MIIDQSLAALIDAIHDAPHQLVLEFAGAGSCGLAWLHLVPGSSRTVLEATDRYAHTSLSELLGGSPAKAVSQETALAMASQAYLRALRLTNGAPTSLGVGCTAALTTDYERRGADRCWVAVRNQQGFRVYGLMMNRQQRDRAEQEVLVSQLLVQAIAVSSGVRESVQLDLLPDEQFEHTTQAATEPLTDLIAGSIQHLTVRTDGSRVAEQPVVGVLLSGSFNPLHAGHEQLAYTAGQALGLPWSFELPIVNADKPPLEYAEIERRLTQFRGIYQVTLSREALFVGKAKLFPGCVFVIGYDTARRFLDPHYYGGEAGLYAACDVIRAQGCRFVVAGRVAGEQFYTLDDLAMPSELRDLFIDLPASAFRVDVSSSEIRQWRAAALANSAGQ